MPSQREDYLLRQIEFLRQIIARLRNGDLAGLDEALLLTLNLQEKLFPLPPPEFLQLEVADQVERLHRGESKPAGDAKCLLYAQLLAETAKIYSLRDQEEFAIGARQLALHVVLHVALDAPVDPVGCRALIDQLETALDGVSLHAPVEELLDRYRTDAGT